MGMAQRFSRCEQRVNWAGIEHEIKVIVRDARRGCRQHPQASRHAEVQQQRAVFELDQKIFGTPSGNADALASQQGRQRSRYAPSQTRLVHGELDDATANDVRLDAAPRRFDLRKLRHARRLPQKRTTRLEVGLSKRTARGRSLI